MKKYAKISIIALALVLIVCLGACSIEGNNSNPTYPEPIIYSVGLEFRLRDDGESYALVGLGTCRDLEIAVPPRHLDYPVTEIDQHAFTCYHGESITSVIIPDSVTYISSHAFERCVSLESVVLSDSITVIEDATFYECYSLKNIVIPDSVIEIGGKAFLNCWSLTEIKIPDSVKIIDFGAFDHCKALTSVVFGENSQLNTIGFVAFQGCTALKSIVIPESVKNMDSEVFLYCEDITIYCEADSQPYGWHSQWNNVQYEGDKKANVVWGYTGE